MALAIVSSAFDDGGEIPREYTCEGNDTSPPLSWSGVPWDAHSLVLIVDNPDAPDPQAPKMTWVHWVLYNIPGNVSGLDEATELYTSGVTDFGQTCYNGPMPPNGHGMHNYYFWVLALDEFDDDPEHSGEKILEAVQMAWIEERD